MLNNKLLLILRQEDSGFAQGGEAGGFCKAELQAGRVRITVGAQNLAPLPGMFYAVLYYPPQGTVLLGTLNAHPKGLFMATEQNTADLLGAPIVAAGVFYSESGFCYPVMLGHKGSGVVWQSEMTEGACALLGLRKGSNYKVWSFMDDTIEFTPAHREKEPAELDKPENKTENTAQNTRRPLTEENGPPSRENFFCRNASHFEKLLRENAPVPELEELVPGSKWVRIDYKDNKGAGHYIVGVIYAEDKPQHICYGVPGEYSQTPPQELEGFCQWIPAHPGEQKEGYWMLFQSAEDGESCRVDDE